MGEGEDRIAALGGRIARIAISPRYRADYNSGGSGCLEGFRLGQAAREDPDLRRALGHPAMETVIVTVFDGVSYPDCMTPWYLVPAFYTPERTQAIENEYSDFAAALFEVAGRSGKRFILANWESDNAIYCYAAYAYATNEGFRRGCDAGYPAAYAGNRGPDDSLEGLRLWMLARSRGIAAGRRLAAEAGLSGTIFPTSLMRASPIRNRDRASWPIWTRSGASPVAREF